MADLCTVVHVNVYDRDGSTLRGRVVADLGSLQWSDLLGELGSATLTVKLLQTIMQSDEKLLDDGAIVKLATNQTTDPDTDGLMEFFGFLAEAGQYALIGPDEKAGEQRSLQCRGLLALFDDFVVYPEGGFHDTASDSRVFGWMSKEGSDWFDVTQWDGTISATKWKDVGSGADRYKKPKGWPDPNAYWVGCGTKEKQYFRCTFDIADDIPIKIFAAADEDIRVYLDSERIIKNNSKETGYLDLNHWRGMGRAGTHTLGVHFLKEPGTVPGWSGYPSAAFDEADKMILTVVSLAPDGRVKDVLRRSSDGAAWKACQRDAGDRPPTWTAAGILMRLMAEASDRGVQSVTRLGINFSATTDSDGNAWDDLHEKSFPVGTGGLKVLTDLSEHDVDFDMLPDLSFNGYVSQGSDKSATVSLVTGVNILELTAQVFSPIATTMLVRGRSRWVEVSDSYAERVGDRVEGFLQTGGSLSRLQAKHHGTKALEVSAIEREVYTCTFFAADGCVPYRDFGKGDWISVPDKTGTALPMRVLSISGATPDEGPIRWTVELQPMTAPVGPLTGAGGGTSSGYTVPAREGDVLVVAVTKRSPDTGDVGAVGVEVKDGGSWTTDGTEQVRATGVGPWGMQVFTVAAPTHNPKLRITTDTSVGSWEAVIYRLRNTVPLDIQSVATSGGWLSALGGGERHWTATAGSHADYFFCVAWDCGDDLADIPLTGPVFFGESASNPSFTVTVSDLDYVNGCVIGLAAL